MPDARKLAESGPSHKGGIACPFPALPATRGALPVLFLPPFPAFSCLFLPLSQLHCFFDHLLRDAMLGELLARLFSVPASRGQVILGHETSRGQSHPRNLKMTCPQRSEDDCPQRSAGACAKDS